MPLQPLPIDARIPEALDALKRAGALVLEAEPGAGKTTRLPWALMQSGLAGDGEVLVLQPRRLAVRLAARRIADEQGEKLGERVGYQVRFDEVSSPRTRLKLITEGILTRRLVSDPSLRGVGAVVLDEFHERHLQGDLGLAMLQRLRQTTRPDLKLVVMSATLQAAPVVAFLGGAPHLQVAGRRFEVKVDHLERPDERPLETQVTSAVKRLVQDGLDGDVLVFLPGAAEIRRAGEALGAFAAHADLELAVLHGDLTPEEQDLALRASRRRKVILSTNVAESSVTLEGVVAVVDSGLARVAGHSPWSGLPTLKTARTSKASAVQRAGRAGRTRPGRCLRLFTEHDFVTRPDHDLPEMSRLDLAEPALALHGLGVADLKAFGWFERPPLAALDAAEELLQRLGTVDARGQLTPEGKLLLELPLHPRQGRVLLEARRRGAADDGAVVAALLGEQDLRLEARARLGQGNGPGRAALTAPSDVLELLALFREAERAGFDLQRLRGMGVDGQSARGVDRVRKQLGRARLGPAAPPAKDPDHALQLALLAGYPDRVARRRQAAGVPGGGAPELLLSGGGTAVLDEKSVVREATWLLALDAEERAAARQPGQPRTGVRVRVASAIEPDWLLDLFPDRVVDQTEFVWNAAQGRVEGISRLVYDGLVLEESRETQVDGDKAWPVLAKVAKEKGAAAFVDPEALAHLVERTRFLAEQAPDVGVPALDDALLQTAMDELCRGKSSLAELRDADLLGVLQGHLGPNAHRMAEWAPSSLKLPNGRNIKIHYEPGKPPWAESFLQDFYGMANGPTLARGRVPLVLHLLAPNRRAVQVSTDLAGFWERHYPGVRKELGRRYPRHSWPDDPLHAAAPPPRPPRPPRR
jgi:ATP-dependent helicase HrpB